MTIAGALEAAVPFIVQKLGDFAVGRSQQFGEIKQEIDWIRGELSTMKAFIKDAERRMETGEAFKEWVKQVKSAAFMIEDFMDEYVYHEQSFQERGSSCSDQVQNFNLQMVNTVKALKDGIEGISRTARACGIHSQQSFGLGAKQEKGKSSRAKQDRPPLYSFPFEHVNVVGFDEEVSKLVKWLLTQEEENTWSFMFVVGMGGSGKTTLAKKVYSLILNHFDNHLFVTAPEFDQDGVDNFLRNAYDGLQRPRLRKKLAPEQQHEKRYALLLDIDDWDAYNYMEHLQGLFVDLGEDGCIRAKVKCKIIITLRNNIMDIPPNENYQVHMLEPLLPRPAWDLFCVNAFENHTCPSHLNAFVEVIVGKCGGLPLAIVLMGRLMSKYKGDTKKWKDVAEHFDQELIHNSRLESLNMVLESSFNELPSHLKYCFLYCCLFPQHRRIKRGKITRLWVAQRLVERQGKKPLEDIADDYFIQLIERSFLKPIFSEFTGEIIACNVHETMRSFAIGTFPEEFGILTDELCDDCEQKRFLALQNNKIQCERRHSKAHAFLFFDFVISSFMDELHSHKFLKVLCLDDMMTCELPNNLGDLFHLRYLSLKGAKIKVLPDSLVKLYNLETLDVRGTRIQSIPTNLVELRKLRHLLLNDMEVYGTNRRLIMPTSIGNLVLLQTLSGVQADDNFIREVGRLVNLRKLYIRLIESILCTREIQDGPEHPHEILCTSIQKIESLHSLKVESLDEMGNFTKLRLETLCPSPDYLKKLVLGGVIKQLPDWLGHLRSLRVLVLIHSMLIADPLSDLTKLPNLVSLKLIHAFTGKQMCCGPGGFPKLQHLHMKSLVEFEEWTAIAESDMPSIKFLTIIDCKKLRMLPEGFEQLITLQSLEVIDMPEFIARLMQEDNSRIMHIPTLILHDKELYLEMESRIKSVVKLGQVSEAIQVKHRGFSEWKSAINLSNHQTILQILIDGRDPNAVDNEGRPLPTLVYLAREKRLQHHHHFKAGALNALIRVSSEINNGPMILNVDCDMYSNSSETVKDAMCFFMDEDKGQEIGFVRFP